MKNQTRNWTGFFVAFTTALLTAPVPANAQARLAQTIDLKSWGGVPVTIVQPPPPQPAPGFSLTSVAFNPVSNTLYVADYATTNVYAVDGATNTVTSAVYTNGLYSTADIGATQNLPGTAPKVVLANPLTNRWIFMGQGGGAQFSGTTFVEGISARAFQSGGAWDPATDNVYGTDGFAFAAVNNLKFLYYGGGCAGVNNAVAFHPVTSRVYVSCGGSQTGGIGVFDGVALSTTNFRVPNSPIGTALLGVQPAGVAVNANTNRIYVVGMTNPTSVDMLDASSLQLVGSIAGLPDQSADFLMAGYTPMLLPRPVAINTVTNTIYVLNSVSSTISVIDGRTNTLTGTIAIPVPAGALVSQTVPPNTLLFEIKPGNTYYDRSAGTLNTLGGAIAMAVNEAANTLYVAGVNGTVGVYALDPPAAAAAFAVYGVIRNAQGVPAAGVSVSATGLGGNATAVTDATGLFALTGLPLGTYTVTPASAAYSFGPASQTVSVIDRNVTGVAFQANPPIVPASFTLSPWTTIGAGVTTTGTITLNQAAPAGGAVVTLSASDPKAAKVPSSVTIPAGQFTASFPVQGSGVSVVTVVTLSAKYNGGTASATLTVAPGDKASITLATFSQATHTLTVNATDSNPQAILNVYQASNNQLLGVMVNQGGGSYTLSVQMASSPGSVNVVSNLGAKTGQGVSVTP